MSEKTSKSKSALGWQGWVSLSLLVVLFLFGAAFEGLFPVFSHDYEGWYTQIAGLITNALASFLILGMGYNKISHKVDEAIEESERRANLRGVLKFWEDLDPDSKGFHIVYGGSLGTFLDDEKQDTSLATIYSINELQETIARVFKSKNSAECCAAANAKDFSKIPSNIVLLGGYKSIPKLQQLPNEVGLPFVQDFEDNRRRVCARPKDYDTQETTVDGKKIVTCDYALITIIVDAQSRCLIWCSGNYGLGTYGAVLSLTRPDLIGGLKVPARNEWVQAIIEINDIENNGLDQHHKTIRVERFHTGSLHGGFSIDNLKVAA